MCIKHASGNFPKINCKATWETTLGSLIWLKKPAQVWSGCPANWVSIKWIFVKGGFKIITKAQIKKKVSRIPIAIQFAGKADVRMCTWYSWYSSS